MDNSGPSDLQWSSLMDHIREDQEMLHGVYLHPGGKNRLKKKWETLAILVNNVDIASAQKTGPQWKSAWSSLKGRARKAYRDKVGPRVPGQPLPDPAVVVGLSDHHRRVLAMIGLQNIMGHNQVPQVDDENIDQPAALAAIAPAAEGHPQHAANDMPPAVLAPNAAIPAAEGHLQQAANDVPPAVPAPYAAIPAAEGHLQQAANDVPPAVPAPHAAIPAAEGHLQQAANDVPPAVPARGEGISHTSHQRVTNKSHSPPAALFSDYAGPGHTFLSHSSHSRTPERNHISHSGCRPLPPHSPPTSDLYSGEPS